MDDLTPERLAEIESRANAATPGPWIADRDEVLDDGGFAVADAYGAGNQRDDEMDANAALIADLERWAASIERKEHVAGHNPLPAQKAHAINTLRRAAQALRGAA